MDLPEDRFLRFEPSLSRDSAHFGHVHGFDKTFMLREAHRIGAEFPRDASFRMSPSFPDQTAIADAVSTLDSELVVSPRARAVFEAHGVGDDVEWLEVGLVDHAGERHAVAYSIANVLRHADIVDLDASGFTRNLLNPTMIMNVTRLVLDASKLPDGVSMFRLSALPRVMAFRRDLAVESLAAGLIGFEFSRIVDFRG